MPLSRPEAAPARPDLPWLRRRRTAVAPVRPSGIDDAHPERTPASQPAPATPPSPPSSGIDYTHPRRRSPAPARPAAAPTPARSLDLSRPAAPAPTPAPSLDLSRPAAPAPPPADDRRRRTRAERLPYPRVGPGETIVLDRSRPTVTLTRLQSGVGALRVSLLRGPSSGDLELGTVCQTTDGTTSVVQRLSDPPGSNLATPAAPLPLVRLSTHGGVDTLSVHLRQVRSLRRALVYGYSPGDAVVPWQGVLVVRLQDDTRLEVPVDLPPVRGTLALLTVYAVAGELVLRAELEPCAGPPETAAQAYGFAHVWLDGRLPVPAVDPARGRPRAPTVGPRRRS